MRKRGREGKGGEGKKRRGREEGGEGVERGVAGLLAVSQSGRLLCSDLATSSEALLQNLGGGPQPLALLPPPPRSF